MLRQFSKAGKAGAEALTSEILADLRKRLVSLNEQKILEVQSHMEAAITNVTSGVDYKFVKDDGPRLPQVTAADQLVDR